MVDDLGNRIDMAQEHVGNVNTRMKVRFTYESTMQYPGTLNGVVSVPVSVACLLYLLTCC